MKTSNLDTQIGINRSDLDSIIKVFATKNKIEKVILFGSRANGKFTGGSDIDIALTGKDLNLDDIITLNLELHDLMLPYKFDILIYDRISEPALKEHINRVGITLYQR